jgi:hypothetical protein
MLLDEHRPFPLSRHWQLFVEHHYVDVVDLLHDLRDTDEGLLVRKGVARLVEDEKWLGVRT